MDNTYEIPQIKSGIYVALIHAIGGTKSTQEIINAAEAIFKSIGI